MTSTASSRQTMESAIVGGRWTRFQRGSLIHHAEAQGDAWRVLSGSVRGWTTAG